jgi:hypothetical protein
VIPADRFDGQLVDHLPLIRGVAGATANLLPIDLNARCFEDAPRGGGDFRADTFAGD